MNIRNFTQLTHVNGSVTLLTVIFEKGSGFIVKRFETFKGLTGEVHLSGNWFNSEKDATDRMNQVKANLMEIGWK